MSTSIDIIRDSLEKHNATFESLLNLIPAKYYLVQDLSEEQVRKVLLAECLQFVAQASREDSLKITEE